MPVAAYVTRDAAGRPWPPLHSHEVTGAVALLQRLHEKLNAETSAYAVVANVRHPSADLVVITELGVGVVELKNNMGKLVTRGGTWLADRHPIKAGSDSRDYSNPREQVQLYATQIHDQLAQHCAEWWSIDHHRLMRVLKVQAAVCFTHPLLTIPPETREEIEREADAVYEQQGRFDLLTPNEFPSWVSALRFELADAAHQYQPYRLSPAQVARLVRAFHGIEWTEVRSLLPSEQPYSYLILRHDGRETHCFPLRQAETIIGRSGASCALVIPSNCTRTSRRHAQFSRYANDVWLQDLHSKHGTFVNGVRIGQTVSLQPGDQITLGGSRPDPSVGTLTFFHTLPDDVAPTQTDKIRTMT